MRRRRGSGDLADHEEGRPQFFFTDHDRDIVFGGDTYSADAGFERTAIRSDAGFAVDNLDLVGVFAEGGIVEEEVRAGLFDGAEIRISFVNWDDPDGHGEIRLRRGTLGETRLTPQGYFHAELRGLSQPLAQSTLEVFSPNCRADLGDHRCKFPIQPPELARDQAVSKGAFYRVATAAGTGSATYEDRIYEVIEAGTTAATQPTYDATIGAMTTDGTATLKAYDSFTRADSVEAVTDHRIFTVSEDLSGFADGWFDEGSLRSRPAPTQNGASRSSPGRRAVDADHHRHGLVSSWVIIPTAGSPGGVLIHRRSGWQPTAHLPVARRGLPAAVAPLVSRWPSQGQQHWRSRRRHGTNAPPAYRPSQRRPEVAE